MVSEDAMDSMLTVREVGQLLHIHSNTVRRWSNQGIIIAYRVNPRGDRRFKRKDIARFIAGLNGNKGDERKASSPNAPAMSCP